MNEKEILLYSIIAGILILALIILLCLKRNFNNYLKQSNDIVPLTEVYTYDGFVKRLKGKDEKLITILSMCIKGSDELLNSLGTQGFDIILVKVVKVLKTKIDKKLRLIAHFSYDTFSIALASSEAGKVLALADEISIELEKYSTDAYNLELYYGFDIGYQNVTTLERSLLALKYAMRRDQTVLQYGDEIVNIQSTFDNILDNPGIIAEQFKVYYQPKVDATTGEIVGAEALSRWVDIDGNIIMNPSQYINEFESNGVIVNLDLFVLEEACKLLESMHKRNQKLVTISLNFSRVDFEYVNLIEDVNDIICKYIFNREFIHIEITESAYIKNETLMLTKMQQLRELGFAIEMDDFGSGYSSMGTLMNSKFNVVKMDKIFVENNLKLKSEQVFLESLVKMFRGVDMDVTVEGVESTYVVRQIRKMAPHVIIQGYYFFKPMPLSKFERILMDSRHVLDDIFNEEVDFENNTISSDPNLYYEEVELIQLDTPEVSISNDGLATWNKISGASSYIYKLNNKKEISTIALSVQLNDGDSIVVKAIGDNRKYENSEYSLMDTYTKQEEIKTAVQLPLVEVEISEDGYATWNPVEGATSYIYKINNKKELSTVATSVKLKDGDSIVVKAVGDGVNYLTGEYSLLDTYTKQEEVITAVQLPQINVYITENGIASWSQVLGAQTYIYKINNKKEISTTLNSVQLKDGDSIVVKAVGDGVNYLTGEYSLMDTYTAVKKVFEPKKLEQAIIEISEDGIASWDSIEGAVSYIYKINNKKEVSTQTLSVKLKDGDSIVVKAVGDGVNYLTGEYSLMDTYTAVKKSVEPQIIQKLPQPSVSISSDGIASWNSIYGAVAYVYKINDIREISTTATSVKLNEKDTIVVKAIGNGINYISSEYSLLDSYLPDNEIKTVIIERLPQPVVEISEDGIASWDEITGCDSYVYKVNNKKEISTTTTSVKLKNGDSIIVKAIGDGVNYASSEYSLLDTYIEESVDDEPIKLPQLEVEISDDGIASWDKIVGAISYIYKINNKKEVSTTAHSVKLNDGDSIVVKAVGDGEEYITSDYSLMDTYVSKKVSIHEEKNKIKLGTPLVTITEDGLANWNAVPNAASYIYKINNGEEISTTALRVQLEDEDFIIVKASGDGINYTDGDYSDELTYVCPFDDIDLSEYDDGYSDDVTEEELAVGSVDESEEDQEARVLRLIDIYKKQYRDEWEAEMLKKYPDLMKKHFERKQFLEKLANLDNNQSDNYNKIKNEIMKYSGLKNRTTKYFDTFINKTTIIVKLGIVGKSIRLYLALDPNAYPNGQFPHKDVSDKKRHAKTPFLIKISSGLSVKRAIKLIQDLAVNYKLPTNSKYEEKNYVKGMKLQYYKSKQQ